MNMNMIYGYLINIISGSDLGISDLGSKIFIQRFEFLDIISDSDTNLKLMNIFFSFV